jgi:hypothetical protein
MVIKKPRGFSVPWPSFEIFFGVIKRKKPRVLELTRGRLPILGKANYEQALSESDIHH